MQSEKGWSAKGRQQVSKAIVRLLGDARDERLLQMVRLGRHLSDDPEVTSAIDTIEQMLRTGHPAKDLFRRVMKILPPDNRVKLFHTLFANAFFLGGKKRDHIEATLGFRPPFIMILSPSLHCNLRCKGCYTLGYGTKPQLDYPVVADLLRQCRDLGIYFVTILGGEPLIYPHLMRMLKEFPDIFFQVYTNGTLISDEVAKRFRRAGNVAVVVSIEGDEQETDAWRGPGVYRRIMRAFEILRRHRVLFGTSATVTRENVYKVASLPFIDRMIELGSVAQMYFLYIPVNGQARMDLMVTPEQREHLRRHVIRTRRSRPIFLLDFWNDGPYVEGCIAGGRRYFHVNAKGDVEPCVYTHIAEHNIKYTPLVEALGGRLFGYIRSCQPHNQNHLRPCMIIDNPQVMRRVIDTCHPRFTHPGAEEIYTERAAEMDAYAAAWGRLADRVWEQQYPGGKLRLDRDLPLDDKSVPSDLPEQPAVGTAPPLA